MVYGITATNLYNESTVADACKFFDSSDVEVLPVMDNFGAILGHVSDFEVRKFILGGGSLADSVLPLIKPQCSETISEESCKERNNLAVLMVGGAGTRLRPLTDNCPKPLLPVKGKPLLERTIEHLYAYGFRRFCFAVGYMADSIIDYFQDGARWNVSISYIREEKRLGTCGALRLLPAPEQTVLVMNGDLITGVKYDNLLRYHQRSGARATLCVSPYDVSVPYGVVECDGIKMASLREKPTNRHWISAGIYLLEPDTISLIPPEGEYDMPSLLQNVAASAQVSVYPIREQWIDIGSVEEYERANREAPDSVPGKVEESDAQWKILPPIELDGVTSDQSNSRLSQQPPSAESIESPNVAGSSRT